MTVLRLDANEGARPGAGLFEVLASAGPELLRRYPDVRALEEALAARFDIAAERVVVTAGADDAIDRCFRGFLGAGRTVVLPEPTFEMFERFAALARAEAVRVPWQGEEFPTDEVLARIDARTAVVVIVSPNNPTGAIASLETVRRVAHSAPGALVLLDQAYVEYADEDYAREVLDCGNVVVVRTFSKAWGLAGCRVGYAMATPEVISVLRAAGGPYPVAGPSVTLAGAALEGGEPSLRVHVERVRDERRTLSQRLARCGLCPRPSQGNFVLVGCGARAGFLAEGLAAQGILVRSFPGRAGLEDAVRITLPGDAAEFERLLAALEVCLAPEALLLDLGGVLADVQGSQRACIVATARAFGVEVTSADVQAALLAGDANNDWVVTWRLVSARGVAASLAAVTDRYQRLYLGSEEAAGLREQERLLVPRRALERLAAARPLGVVTGRPRAEATWFLERTGVADLLGTVVCMEDAPPKPDPAPVRLALDRLGVERAWMVGDTPDDLRAALAAGVLPLALAAPGDDRGSLAAALLAAGAARVLASLGELEELLP